MSTNGYDIDKCACNNLDELVDEEQRFGERRTLKDPLVAVHVLQRGRRRLAEKVAVESVVINDVVDGGRRRTVPLSPAGRKVDLGPGQSHQYAQDQQSVQSVHLSQTRI